MKLTNHGKPNRNLEQALENIETFSEQIKKEIVPNLSHLEVQGGKVVALPHTSLKTISLAYGNIIFSHKDKQSEVLDEILHSSDVIKSYLPLLQVMEEGGTAEQKKFAAYAKSAIERFNHVVDEATSSPHSWQKRIVCFLFQKSGLHIGNRLIKIELPQKAFVQIDFPQQSSSGNVRPLKCHSGSKNQISAPASEKISHLREAVLPAFQVHRQTLELYYMKVIALLERNKLLPNNEARYLVLKTPTMFEIDKQTHLLTINQILVPLPGQKIEVSATFRMDPRTLIFNIFESDNLFLEATQTGFPHPLQHHGWALSDRLIPQFLHRPNLIKLFPQLNFEKQSLAKSLLPNGSLAGKARLFLRLKREIFEKNKLELITYHKNLVKSIIEASSPENLSDKSREITNHFFTILENHISAYDLLSSVNQTLMKYLIELPYDALEAAWLQGEVTTLESAREILSNKFKTIFENLKEENEEETKTEIEKSSLSFISVMCYALAPAIQQLILQQKSEIMEFPPPQLDLLAKKLQAAIYLQLWEFQHEMTLEPSETDIFRRLTRLLEDDITLFKADNLNNLPWKAVDVVHELEVYYKERMK